MEFLKHLSLPLSEPVLIFTVILFIILLVPIFLKRLGVPPIIGFIFIGIIIGPHALNLVLEGHIVELFSQVGLYYIMFLAGLEIEFVEFKKQKAKGIFFGFSTFILPFIAGFLIGTRYLNYSIDAAILIGILMASHTLVAFTITQRLGLNKTSIVNTAISGTIIADTLVLILLAYVIGNHQTTGGSPFIVTFLLSFGAFAAFTFLIIPRMSRWFFKNITSDGNLQFLYVFSILFLSAFLAEVAGAEGLIGAFFAGLALNRLIPSSSTLMNRIEFVGNTLFIPVFLISVGMLFNLNILLNDLNPLIISAFLIFFGLTSKWISAVVTKLIFKFSWAENSVLFGLSSARAAATLAVVLVGFQYEILPNELFNATIIFILVSSLYSSIVTERGGRKLAREITSAAPQVEELRRQKILVPLANPNSVQSLMEFGLLIKKPSLNERIYPLIVIKKDKDADTKVIETRPLLDKAKSIAAEAGSEVKNLIRVDVNIPDAIVKTCIEMQVTTLVLGWGRGTNTSNRFFGSVLENILAKSNVMVLVSHIIHPINISKNLSIYVTEHAEMEYGFQRWVQLLAHISKELSTPITFHCHASTEKRLRNQIESSDTKIKANYLLSGKEGIISEAKEAKPGDITYFVISARPQTLSFNPMYWSMRQNLTSSLSKHNLFLIYPEIQ